MKKRIAAPCSSLLRCRIKTLRIPRFLPSFVFVSYRGDTCQGQTKMIKANQPLKRIEESFEIEYTKGITKDITFAVNAKSPLGTVFRFGEEKVRIPEIVYDKKEHDVFFDVTAEAGKFEVDVSFQMVERDWSKALDPSLGQLLAAPSTITRYVELVSTIGPTIDIKEAVTKFYSDSGIPSQSAGLAKSRTDVATVQELRQILPVLLEKTEKAQYISDFTRTASLLLIERPSDFISASGVLTLDDVKECKESHVTVVAAYIMRRIEGFMNGSDKKEGVDLEEPLLHLLSIITDMSRNLNDDILLMCLTATTFFVCEFLRQKYPTDFPQCQQTLGWGFRSMVIKIIGVVTTKASMNLSASRLKTELRSKEGWFKAFDFPPEVWATIKQYIYKKLDLLVGEQWKANESSGPLPVDDYKKQMPDYNWPLITEAQEIYDMVPEIVKSKSKLARLSAPMKGSWLGSILRKREVPEKVINKLVKNWSIEPTVENIDEWAMENLNFAGKWVAPSIPDCPLFAPTKVLGQHTEPAKEENTQKEEIPDEKAEAHPEPGEKETDEAAPTPAAEAPAEEAREPEEGDQAEEDKSEPKDETRESDGTDSDAEASASEREEPTPSKDEPAPDQEESTSGKEEPAPSKEEPTSSKEEPARSEEEPAPSKEEPMSSKEEPMSSKEEPMSSKEEPMSSKEEPMSSKEEPMSSKEEPTSSTDGGHRKKHRHHHKSKDGASDQDEEKHHQKHHTKHHRSHKK